MKSLNTHCEQNEKLLHVKAGSKPSYCCHCALNGYILAWLRGTAVAVIPRFLSLRSTFNLKVAHMGFAVDKVALAQVFLTSTLDFFLPDAIPPMLS
jgi:hypothetical protein